MHLSDYVCEIEYAATNVLTMIWWEQSRLAELTAEIKTIGIAVEDAYQRAIWLQDSNDPDDIMMGAGLYFENYFGNEKEMSSKNAEAQTLQNRLTAHRFSVSALSGSLQNRAFHLRTVNWGFVRTGD